MTYKKLEGMRQVRLMVTEVILPVTTIVVVVAGTLANNQKFMDWHNEKKRKREIKKFEKKQWKVIE